MILPITFLDNLKICLFGACNICGKLDGSIKETTGGTIYEEIGHYYYHQECLKEVIQNLDKYNADTIDRALVVAESISVEKRRKEKSTSRASNQLGAKRPGKRQRSQL